MTAYVIAIDQGTTSTRAIVYDKNLKAVASEQQEFQQYFPRSGWVEHDAEEIWDSVVGVTRRVIERAALNAQGARSGRVAAIGISNQRETVVIWDRKTGAAIHKALVWQDRRTAADCQQLKDRSLEAEVTARSGLLLDPYFSASKITWLLDNVDGARAKAEKGELAFGTIDSFLLWRLTGGKVHATDATNAARTNLYNIHKGCWDEHLLKIFNVPAVMLPQVRDNAGHFGDTLPELFEPGLFGSEHSDRAIPVMAMAGDQQAATVGQACFHPGMLKSTYGTGCFALLNTGDRAVVSKNRMLTTIAYQLDGKPAYALEGSIFVAGAGVQWLRDGLGILDDAPNSGLMAARADPEQQVYLVPAFTGLGAPYWDAQARGAMFGLTRNTGPNEFAKATLEAVCFQTRDLLDAMNADLGAGLEGGPGMQQGAGQSAEQGTEQQADRENLLRVDGGMAQSDWVMQRLADVLGIKVERPENTEATALGVAYLAGMAAGVYPDVQTFADSRIPDRVYRPQMADQQRERLYAGWQDAVRRTLSTGV